MKIALFYPNNLYAGWYAQGGYRRALERLGHEVVDAGVPGNLPHHVEELRPQLPAVADLVKCDLVLSAYHEYMTPWYAALYGADGWRELLAQVPVVARFDESFDRRDLGLAGRWAEFQSWANRFSFPAAQDARRYGGQWLPFGADLTMFHPTSSLGEVDVTFDQHGEGEKKYELGFVGSLYPLRHDYLNRLANHLPNTLTFHAGPVVVQDLGGIRGEDSTRLLAENYRQIKVFFCLPPMSHLMVAKIFDVMACGTFVLAPRLPGAALENCALFKDGEHLAYYDVGYLKKNAELITRYLEDDAERGRVAAAGAARVREKFTLTRMLADLLAYGLAPAKDNVVEIGASA